MTLWLTSFIFGRAIDARRGGRVVSVLLIVSLGIALGALWEVAEWGFDQIAPGDIIKGKYDTIVDVIMDTFGSVLAAILAFRLSHPKP